ncbi:hypothetical protein [Escherichia coli]|uniref:hypothetical protein n=1 Tax=Escherichia coli TaxID=562 RepID=UPI001CA6CD96|nr:hypothetical protein [Escherichia coli]QZY67691.1 hypothetical protein K7X33_16485 [Escherichia coli]
MNIHQIIFRSVVLAVTARTQEGVEQIDLPVLVESSRQLVNKVFAGANIEPLNGDPLVFCLSIEEYNDDCMSKKIAPYGLTSRMQQIAFTFFEDCLSSELVHRMNLTPCDPLSKAYLNNPLSELSSPIPFDTMRNVIVDTIGMKQINDLRTTGDFFPEADNVLLSLQEKTLEGIFNIANRTRSEALQQEQDEQRRVARNMNRSKRVAPPVALPVESKAVSMNTDDLTPYSEWSDKAKLRFLKKLFASAEC